MVSLLTITDSHVGSKFPYIYSKIHVYIVNNLNLEKLYRGVFLGLTLILQSENYSQLGLLLFDWLLANLKVSMLQLLPG